MLGRSVKSLKHLDATEEEVAASTALSFEE
jgi:hypothetical protein